MLDAAAWLLVLDEQTRSTQRLRVDQTNPDTIENLVKVTDQDGIERTLKLSYAQSLFAGDGIHSELVRVATAASMRAMARLVEK